MVSIGERRNQGYDITSIRGAQRRRLSAAITSGIRMLQSELTKHNLQTIAVIHAALVVVLMGLIRHVRRCAAV